MTDDRRRAAEMLKDMIVERKRSRWPIVLGMIVLLAIGGGAYWYYLPPNQRPAFGDLEARLQSWVHTAMNTPVAAAPAPPPSQSPQKSASPHAGNDTGLLSN